MAGNVQHRLAVPQGEHGLSYARWVGIVLDEHIATGKVPTVHVQVRKRGVVLCGRVLEASPAREGSDTDWFKVDCYLGQIWFADGNVRQCSGLDGRCHCTDVGEVPEGAHACGGASGVSPAPSVTRGQQCGWKA